LDYQGESAKREYYSRYKKLDFILDEDKTFNVTKSAFTEILNTGKKLNLLPRRLDFIKN